MIYQSIAPDGAKKPPIKIVNGKLVLEAETGLADLSIRIEELAQKCEQITPQNELATQGLLQNQEQYARQIAGIKKAIDKLESLYRKLFWLGIFIIILLMLTLFARF